MPLMHGPTVADLQQGRDSRVFFWYTRSAEGGPGSGLSQARYLRRYRKATYRCRWSGGHAGERVRRVAVSL